MFFFLLHRLYHDVAPLEKGNEMERVWVNMKKKEQGFQTEIDLTKQ